jgi:flagellar export protein FliJ
MMKFKFSLEKVLTHRRRLEDEARRDWILAQAKTQEAIRRLEALYAELDDARARQIKTRQGSSILGQAAATLQAMDHFVDGQRVRIERQRVQVRELKSEEERFQDLLAQRAQERRALEKLRERRLQEFMVKIERAERLEVEDLSVMRHGRFHLGTRQTASKAGGAATGANSGLAAMRKAAAK